MALLVNAAPAAWAQDSELSDTDLQTLLEENDSQEVTSDTVSVDEPTAVEASPEESIIEPAETEVVTDVEPSVEPTAAEPETTTADTTFEDLEPLESNETNTSDMATLEKPADELDELKMDIGENQEFKPGKDNTDQTAEIKKEDTKPVVATEKKDTTPEVFDVGREERELLVIANNIQGQISDNEWNEVATAAKVDSYTVVKNDWLFKISKKVFGSGYIGRAHV